MRAKGATPVLFPAGQEALPHAAPGTGPASRDEEDRLSLAVCMPAARGGAGPPGACAWPKCVSGDDDSGYPAPG